MASAVLTALQGNSDDERFTIIDWRRCVCCRLGSDGKTVAPFIYCIRLIAS